MKFLIVGLGSVGQRHARNLRMLAGTDADIAVVRQRGLPLVINEGLDVQPGVSPEEQLGLRRIEDLSTALEEAPDAVFVCNPTHLHVPVALAAARAGCHLFIEKPLSFNLDDVPDLLNTIDSHGVISCMGYQMRFHPCLLMLKEALKDHAIGRPLAARLEQGEYLPGWHPYEDYRESYAARRDQGGGVILSQIHEFDVLYWLFGLPRRVACVGGHLSSLEIDVEDVASSLFDYNIEGQPLAAHVQQDYLQRPARRGLQIIGDAGKIEIDLLRPSYLRYDRDGRLVQDLRFCSYERSELFVTEMKHFLSCLSRQEAPQVSARDGAQSLAMALAARESLATGEFVSVSTQFRQGTFHDSQ